jgi:oligopeptide/dipeptide ABC transporter ATP-binding protein
VLRTPRHPYTVALLGSVPSPDPEQRGEMKVIGGEVPSAVRVPSGCRFHPRCPFRMEVCDRVQPELHEPAVDRLVACHLPDDFDVGGQAASGGHAAAKETKEEEP